MSKSKRERGLFELYQDDPERADALVFGRRTKIGRRGFVKGAGLATMGAVVGGAIPFSANMPAGLIPQALAQQAPAAGKAPAKPKTLEMQGKAGLIVLEERPLNCETPAHLLDDDVTPTANMYIRNNGIPPEPTADPDKWQITIDGEVNTPLKLTLGELKKRFANVTLKLQLECGGNGRSFFVPEARGNQWGHGAAGQPEWTGVRLRDVLNAAGLKPNAVYTAHYGADQHLSGDPKRTPLSRGVRLVKAMEQHSLIVFAMNGKPLHIMHGFPVRLVVPGWSGSASQKWLTRIWIRDKEHDGPGMTGTSYRLTNVPMVPGAKHDPKNMQILEAMPMRSLITNVADGTELPAGTRDLALRGHAWAGEKKIAAMHVSIDYGQTWTSAEVAPPVNKYAWQNWRVNLRLPSHGYFELWSRATDNAGHMQPHVAPNWNPSGYGGNPFHRVAVLVKA